MTTDRAGLTVGGFSALMFTLVVSAAAIHEWSYFFVLQGDVFTLVSAIDLPSLFLPLTPWIIAGVGLITLLTLRDSLFRRANRTSLTHQASGDHKRRTAVRAANVALILVPAMYLLVFMHVLMVVLWLLAMAVQSQRFRKGIEGTFGRRAHIWTSAVVSVLFLFGYIGAHSGFRELGREDCRWTVITHSETVQNACIVRSLTSGLVLRVPTEKRLELVSWAELRRITGEPNASKPESLACRWWGVGCGEEGEVDDAG